ncbi:hypothetical protein PABY_12020 [Pyrodictium abyssi]|uniref:Uncharacterized protein n=1 Tax=Pyrodictium abyssi TaxID=54256 RepID=A0ABN6ZSR3_9CREN|nr:hypothetical protein PABY_12020 [Pyrodictium abyssi]
MGCVLGVCSWPLRDVDSLVEWLRLLGGLRVFWAKPVRETTVLWEEPLILGAE